MTGRGSGGLSRKREREVERVQPVNTFDALVGKLVKAVYCDSGGEVKIKKGTLVAADTDFIQLRTYEHTYIIKRSAITELKTLEGGR